MAHPPAQPACPPQCHSVGSEAAVLHCYSHSAQCKCNWPAGGGTWRSSGHCMDSDNGGQSQCWQWQ
eukprot:5350702-Prorocentrum_lima.AAC.1